MYICVCNAVTDRDIRAAAAAGVDDFVDLQERLGVSTCCGACRDDAQACLNSARPGADSLPRGSVLACA